MVLVLLGGLLVLPTGGARMFTDGAILMFTGGPKRYSLAVEPAGRLHGAHIFEPERYGGVRHPGRGSFLSLLLHVNSERITTWSKYGRK